jgi:uncharacterized membrane protein
MKCPSCGYDNREDAPYCSMCQKSFINAQLKSSVAAQPIAMSVPPKSSAFTQPSVPRATAPKAAAPEAIAKTEMNRAPEKRNWFQNHLSWTWFLSGLSFEVLAIIVLFVLFYTASRSDFNNIYVLWEYVVGILSVIVAFCVGAWVLKRKGRSYAWLLVIFLGLIGTIIFFYIRNNVDYPPSSKYESKINGSEPRRKYVY